jgi:hypothetical protein
MDNQTPEERKVRLKKVDSIRRMLAEQSTTGINRVSGEFIYIDRSREALLKGKAKYS